MTENAQQEVAEAGGVEPQIPAEKKIPYIPVREFRSALASFAAILPPVFATMTLSAVVVLYGAPNSQQAFAEESFLILDETEAESTGQATAFGLANALIFIAAITVMTFLIVLLLYFKCEKCFAAYLFFALLSLMGFTTSLVVLEVLSTYNVPTDLVTFVIFFYNYAVVGAIAIFSFEVGFQGSERLIPYNITQLYLVIISVVMAWLVTSVFPTFTVWALLVCLALYDLCAVLTPCGPLNLLIKVVAKRTEEAQEEAERRGVDDTTGQKQMIPGLLYEVNTGKSKGLQRLEKRKESAQMSELANARKSQAKPTNAAMENLVNVTSLMAYRTDDLQAKEAAPEETENEGETKETGEGPAKSGTDEAATPETQDVEITLEDKEVVEEQPQQGGVETGDVTTTQEPSPVEPSSQDVRAPSPEEIEAKKLEIERLRQREQEEEIDDSNLKLGLGDFVFYSVLTAKSAEFGFIAFIAVAICVLCGLCGTLVLLSVFQKALPALPISIALGVVTYLIAFIFISPFADELALSLATV